MTLESEPGPGTVLASLGAQPRQSAAELTLGPEVAALVPNPWTTQFAVDNFSGHNSSRSSNSTRSKNGDNHYWCTVCEELKSYKDSGSWKKHEKEHETIFVCGLDDATETSRANQSHASKPFTCKRRDVMVHHLNKSHGIVEAHRGRELADQWRHTVRKQAWSCGFCVSLFFTFQDRLRHVDTEHFKKHQSIHEWDLNKVILGLLQQPKMEKAWKERTTSLTPWVQPESFAWDKAIAKGLRASLEMGPLDDRHADSLADAAYSARTRNEESWPQKGIAYSNPHADATAQPSLLPSPIPYQAISALASDPGLYQRPESAIAGPTARLVSGDPSVVEAPTSSFALGNTLEPSMSSTSLADEGRVDYNALLFNPSQGWTPASDLGAFFSEYERSDTYGGWGAEPGTVLDVCNDIMIWRMNYGSVWQLHWSRSRSCILSNPLWSPLASFWANALVETCRHDRCFSQYLGGPVHNELWID